MTQFEFFMTFYGLILGLGVAELFGGFANILRERRMPRLGVILPLMGGIALIEIMVTFVDAWLSLSAISITLYHLILPMLIGLIYFVLGVLMVPRNLDEWPDLDIYFDRRRRWIVGLFIAVNLLTILPAYDRLVDRFGALDYFAFNAWLFASYAVLLFSRRRWLDIAAALSVLAFYLTAYLLPPLLNPPPHGPAPEAASETRPG